MKSWDNLAIQLHRELRRSTSPGLKHFSWATAHAYGDALPAMHRLRHRLFVEEQGYKVPTYNGLEYDEFDTPAAEYFLLRGPKGEAQACLRLIPTTQPYMIERLWVHLVSEVDLPRKLTAWEVSRFGVCPLVVDKTSVIRDMLAGLEAHRKSYGVTEYLFVSHKRTVQTLLGPHAPVEALGEPTKLGRFKVQACRVRLTPEIIEKTLVHHNLQK